MRMKPRLLVLALASGIFAAAFGTASFGKPCDVNDGTQRVHVSDFNAVGDGKTDDGPAIRAALESALAGPKPVSLEFDAGKVYRIASFEDTYALRLLNTQHVTLRGNGAELLLLPPNKIMQIESSSDINVCGLTFDYSPLPFTQGLITSVDSAGDTFNLRIDDGFDVPAVDADNVADNRKVWRFGVPFAASGRFDRRVQIAAVYAGSDPRTVRVKLADSLGLERLMPNETHLVMTMPKFGQTGGFAIRIFGNSRVHFDAIRIYAVPQLTFFIGSNLGPISFTNVEQRRRPGTTRAMTGWRDTFHTRNNRAPVTWNGCYSEGIFDDSFNLSALFQVVEEKLDNNRWRLRDLSATSAAPPFKIGDRLQALDILPARKLLGETKIQSVEQNGKDTVLTVSPPLPFKAFANDCKGDNNDACATRVVDLDAANEGSVIKDCTVRGSIRLRSKVILDHVKLDGTLQITADPIRAGPLPNGIVIRNSELNGHIRIGPDNTERWRYVDRWTSGERWARNIVFQNNKIMSVFRAEGATLSLTDNDIVWPPRRRFLLDNSGPVHIKNLKVDGAPAERPKSYFKMAPDMTTQDLVLDR